MLVSQGALLSFRQSPDHLDVLDRIITKNLGERIVSATRIEGGFGCGTIYRVGVRPGRSDAERDLVVKLSAVQGTLIVEDDDVDARIYGARSWSLAPVHALLRKRGIPTYDLIGYGFPSDDIPFFWIIMAQLAGVEVRGFNGDPDADGFQRVCGEALGALHAVTRTHDGAVDRAEPFNLSWTEAFFGSLENALQRVLVRGDSTFCQHEREIRDFIGEHRRSWVPPTVYALSHPDGLQGHGLHDGTRWRFTGHLDLEDFSFTDARFPLAGYELGASVPVPPSFWDGYRTFREIDHSFETARDLFKLYYLLDWFWIIYDQRLTPTPTAVSQGVDRQTKAILRTIRGI